MEVKVINTEVINLINETVNILKNSKVKKCDILNSIDLIKQSIGLIKKENNTEEDLKTTYEDLYNIHKNDNVVEKQIPYINREFYNHTFKEDEYVLIGFYVDDDLETGYTNDTEAIYKIKMYVDHELLKVDYFKNGSNKMNYGVLPRGEHILSYEAIDIYGRTSYRDYFEIRVKDTSKKVIYEVSDEELNKYGIDKTGVDFENTATGFNSIIENLDSKYNYLLIPNGTYMLKYNEHIKMKDNLTLDLNGSNFTLQPGQIGSSNIQMQIRQCYDSHIINGTVEGDYETHDYKNSPNNSEWVHGISLDGRSKYSSYENITVKNITGYGSISGFAADRDGKGYCWGVQYFDKVYDKASDIYSSKDLIDISKFKVDGCNFFQIGLYLGYQGKPSDTWYYNLQFFDENKTLIDTMVGYYYRRVYIPEDVKYIKFIKKNGYVSKDICVFAFKVPVNCEFKNVRHEMCRCVGCAPSAMESLRLLECYFTRCGQNGAHCAFDSEDGWDMMHDFYMTKTVFENNFVNDWLTCGGHNFLLENNEYDGSIYVWTRCQNYTIRNNKIKNINEGANRPTHHVRIYDNIASDSISSYKGIIKNCKAKCIRGNSENCEIYSLANCKDHVGVNNKYIFKDGWSNYIYNPKIKNSVITYENKETCGMSFNTLDADILFDNVKFIGEYTFSNHNNFNSGTFKNCVIDHIFMDGRCQDNPNNSEILFENCKMTFSSVLIKSSPHAYSKGECHFRFKNCEIIDDGNEYSWAYGKVTDMIYFFSMPIENSYIIFDDCTITKQNGALVGSRTKEEAIKCNIEFNNCTLNGDFNIYGELSIPEKTNIKVFIDGIEQK